MLLALIAMLALTRAELLERFKAPIVTQAEGLVQVYADCPEDMRREYQMPIASFAAETVRHLYAGNALKPLRFKRAGIAIHVGDVRTNVATVIARTFTNGTHVVSRIYVVSPGYADLYRLKLEVIKGFFRSVKGEELTDEGAVAAYRAADPDMRIEDERSKLEEWLRTGKGDDEEGLYRLRRIIKPGAASPRDVLTFAARLYLYPPQFDLKFVGGGDCMSFREALKLAKDDPRLRLLASVKANEMPVFGGGRGDRLKAAADAYMEFLRAFAANELEDAELEKLLEDAETKLNVAYEAACKGTRT